MSASGSGEAISSNVVGNPQDPEPLDREANEPDSDEDVEGQPLLGSSSQAKAKAHSGTKAQPLTYFGSGKDSFLGDLQHHMGYQLLAVLFASQHLMKGFAAGFIAPCVPYLYGSYKVPGPQMQIYSGVTQLPWAMKPVMGLLSDAFPIMGYNKAPYMLTASVFGMAGLMAIGSIPQDSLSVTAVVACLFAIQFQFSTVDLLSEAKYAEKIKANPEKGPALMTFVWFGMQAAGLVAILLIGPILQHTNVKVPFLIALVPASSIIVPVARGYLEEKKLTEEEQQAARSNLMKQKEPCILCLLMLVGSVGLLYLGLAVHDVRINAYGSIAVAMVLLIAFSIFLRPEIAKVNAFFLIQTSVGISISGASFYFYTDTREQYPEGPHFSKTFYTSVLGVAGAICSLVGIYSYQQFASNWSYRRLLLVSNVALSVLSLSDLILFTRLNKRFGCPDEFFVLGASVLSNIVMQWQWMPGVVILSQLCPNGMEAIMYALLAGCHNLGNTIASSVGALVLDMLNCKPSGAVNESKQFEYLWVGSALSTVLPFLSLALLPWLIPDRSQTDKLLEDGDGSATAGSLWRRWHGDE
eukprot:TRINITY_DN82288_c0_g1_i1.p1 TRINITY_DN82288_c0_g1~~TRINITY_DN82288_c0_g1_i1.p1  ORF type:complete len:581 (+),score=107.14 TRINITY_DN82288_c0_g1_i1:192-1934(+)